MNIKLILQGMLVGGSIAMIIVLVLYSLSKLS